MNLSYKIVIAFGILWIAQPLNAQQADSLPVTPAPLRLGPPPKRGAPPVRMADTSDPTLNKGKVEWSTRNIEFGPFPKGTPQVYELKVKNISEEPLRILEAKSSCHCTTVDAPQNDILPGETGIIWFRHNAEDLGEFLRIVSVLTSFDTEHWVIFTVTGQVNQE